MSHEADKRLIDANELIKNYGKYDIKVFVDKLPTVLTIPENPTNGDMIKALFPNAEIFRREEYGYQYVYVTIQDMGSSWKIRGEWWDTQWKEEMIKHEIR